MNYIIKLILVDKFIKLQIAATLTTIKTLKRNLAV